jgi:hypothetical protein
LLFYNTFLNARILAPPQAIKSTAEIRWSD